ncbi:MAG: hypothetical protein P4L61_02260 [Candidatus Pacebacteria bacterium]|nr:hypothetical protein [Candidatus Paceibacterota bacterium]
MKDKEKEPNHLLIIIIVLVMVIAIVPIVFSFVSGYLGPYFAAYYPAFLFGIEHAFGWLVGISLVISVLLLIGIVVAIEGTKHVRKQEAAMYDLKVELAEDTNVKADPALAKKWQNVMSHADSPNASDWRQAIIEADIMLGDILTKMQYAGDGIGDQLKLATKADFKTLDQAWEAHKIRNQIAHEGSDFALDQHEAKRVINLYRQVFEEFFYI